MKRSALYAAIAALGLFAPQAIAQGQPQPGQMQPAERAGAMVDTTAFDEADWAALTTEPSEMIEKARTELGRKNLAGAADELRGGAALLKLSADHFDVADRTKLMEAAGTLFMLSKAVEGAEALNAPQTDSALAFVDQLLAQFHQKQAAAAWSRRELAPAAFYLRAAAKEIQGGAMFAGKPLDMPGNKAVADANKFSELLARGTGFTTAAVDKGLDDLAGQARKLGGQVHRPQNLPSSLSANFNGRDWAALRDQADEALRDARAEFVTSHAQAAKDVREAAMLVKLEASRAGDKSKQALNEAASQLVGKARSIETGEVKTAAALQPFFAKADLALAQSHHELAQRFWGDRKTYDAGQELGAAANSLQKALDTRAVTVPSSVKPALAQAKRVSVEMMRGSGFKAADVDKSIGDLGDELAKVTTLPAKKPGGLPAQAKR